MSNMQREYGPSKGESVFYALANKRKENKPSSSQDSPHASRIRGSASTSTPTPKRKAS